MAGESDILNARDAADFLGVHVETLRKMARRNEIPCFKLGKDWRFRKEALVRWADDQRPVYASNDNRWSVVVIDDEVRVCKVTVDALERLGCQAQYATSGPEGLDRIAEQQPDLILLDLHMPDMSGPQVLAELRREQPTLPVIIVTGYPNSDLMQQAMQFAPVMLLAKPLDRTLLERTIQSLLGEKHNMGHRT